jgi:rod shape-determining protein MreC
MQLVGPVASSVAWTAGAFRRTSNSIRLNRTLIDENRRLRVEIEILRRESVEHLGAEAELQRLSEALAYQRTSGGEIQAADIVYIDHASWLQTAILAVRPSSVRVNQPVVSPTGLVGRVVLVAGGYAKIQLITDRSASVGVMIERTRRQGITHGGGRGFLELDYVPLQSDVRPGDVVVTAGIDGVYPRGVRVGRVASVEAGDELFHRIRVLPGVDFGSLDHVFLLDRDSFPAEVMEDLPDARP